MTNQQCSEMLKSISNKFIILISLFLLSCKKEGPISGIVVAKPQPYCDSDTCTFSIALQVEDTLDISLLKWVHIDKETYFFIEEGQLFCTQ